MIDPQELAKQAKSKFGPAKPLVRPRWKIILEEYLFKSSQQRSYIEGGITVGLLVYWIFSRDMIPLIIWFSLVVANTLIALVYWRKESTRLSKELKQYEKEMQDIQNEIVARGEYFKDIKDQLNKMMNKN